MENEQQNRFMRMLEKFLGGTVITLPQLFSLIFPLFLDQLFVRAISMLNTSMISSYGTQAISAVSMVDSVNNLMVNLFMAISTGCTVVVAQYCGRRDRENANLTVAQSVTSSVAIALVISLPMIIFPVKVIGLLFGKGDELFQDYAVTFLAASAISYPFFAVIQTILGAMRGSGNTKVSVYFSTGLNVLNVLLNIIFLNVFHFGIWGLSISLIVSRAVTAIVIMFYVMRSGNDYPLKASHFFRLKMNIQRSVMTVAVPTGLEQVFFHGGRIVTQMFIVGFGTISTASNAVAMSFSGFLQLPGATMMMAVVTIAGQCIGAGKIDEAKFYIKRITLLAIIGSGIVSVILGATLPIFLSFFTLPPEAYQLTMKLCIMNFILTPLVWPSSFVTPNGLRAAGDARYTSAIALLTMWIVRVLSGYIFGVVLGFGIMGVWAAMFLEWLVRSVFFLTRIRTDKWYHPVIKE